MAEAVKKSYKLKKGAEHHVIVDGALKVLSGDDGASVELFPEQAATIADKLVIEEEEEEEKEEKEEKEVTPPPAPTPTPPPNTSGQAQGGQAAPPPKAS